MSNIVRMTNISSFSYNRYINSSVGAKSRFVRSALNKRAVIPCNSNNLCMEFENSSSINNNGIDDSTLLADSDTPNSNASNFEIWYDGADYSKFQPSSIASDISSAEAITQWNDKSATAHNANNYTGTTSARPTYIGTLSSEVQNGNTSVNFNASNNQGLEIALTGSGNWFFGLTSVTIFMVFKYVNPITDNLTIWSSSQNDLNLAVSSVTNNLIMSSPKITPDPSYNVDISYNLSANTWIQTSTIFDGAGATDSDRLKFRINGIQQSLSFNPTNSRRNYRI